MISKVYTNNKKYPPPPGWIFFDGTRDLKIKMQQSGGLLLVPGSTGTTHYDTFAKRKYRQQIPAAHFMLSLRGILFFDGEVGFERTARTKGG